MPDTGQTGADPRRAIETAISRARAALLWERLWPRLVAPLSVVGLFVALSWFGVWRLIGDWPRLALLALFAAALLVAVVHALRTRRPTRHEAMLRVESASRLSHHPVLDLSDSLSPVAADPAAAALWDAHRRRVLAGLTEVRAGAPHPQVIRRDPYALRFVVPVLLFVAFAVGWGEWSARIADAFSRPAEARTAVASARIDAWIDPPPYTRTPPVFLSRREAGESAAVTVPEGSRLSVRVVSQDPATVALDGNTIEMTAEKSAGGEAGDSIRTYSATLDSDAVATVDHGAVGLSYPITVTDDLPPTVTRGPMNVNRAGTFSLEFGVADDYGVTGGTVVFRPREPLPEDARPLVEAPELQMRVTRLEGGEGNARVDARLESHPYAGLEVVADAMVRDAAGQEGRPADEGEMVLPERPFSQPIARALVEQRRNLALDANRKPDVATALDALAIAPGEFIDDDGIYLALRVAYYRLLDASSDDELRDYLDFLWDLARGIEDGDMSSAERRLQAAREALEEALENGASEQEVAELMQELREAMQEFLESYMAEMAERGLENMPMMPMQDMQTLSQQDLDRMLDRIEDLARLGDSEAARQLLSELQQMLDNLQMAQRGEMQQQGDSEMMRQLDELARLMQEQQRLMDETFQLDQGRRPGEQGEGGSQPMTPEELAELMRRMQEGQGALEDQLQQLLDQMRQGQQGQGQQGEGEGQQGEGQGQGAGERALGRAGRAMGQAERSLGRGESGLAYGQQGQALEALREGMQGMMQDLMARQQQRGMGAGRQVGRGQPNGQTDPLGRPQRNEGPDLGQNVRVPDEIDVERARRILQAIRDRLGERYRPGFELDYLERLIRPE